MSAEYHTGGLSSRLVPKGTVLISDNVLLASEWTIICKVVDVNHERGSLTLALYEFEKPQRHQAVSKVILKYCRADFIDNRNWTYEMGKQLQNGAYEAIKCKGPSEFLPIVEKIVKHCYHYPSLPMPLTNHNFIFMRLNYVGGWISSMEEPKPLWAPNLQTHYACLKHTGELLIHYYLEQQPLDIVELHSHEHPEDELGVELDFLNQLMFDKDS